MDTIKKILLLILGIGLTIASFFIFFYVLIFLLVIGLIYYIYFRFFKRKTKKASNYKQVKTIVIDMEDD